MIELPIYHHDERSNELEQLGIKTPLDETETKMMLFLNINAVGYYKDEHVTCSLIHCNGMSFVCSYSYDELKKKLYERGA